MAPRAIALASSKGGVGKTTLAAALAVRAAKDSDRVALLDLDAQQSLARWWELRGEPKNPKTFHNVEDAAADVALLKRNGWEWVFLDSPPGLLHRIENAIQAADLVLIPLRASPLDLEAVDPAVELCETHGKPFAFVLTHFDPKWRLSATAHEALEDRGRVLKETIGYRQAYVGSMIAGRTGPEYSDREQARAAAKEIDALWAAVRGLTRAKAGK